MQRKASYSNLSAILDKQTITETREKSSTEAQVKLEGLRDYFAMRRNWGNFLQRCLFIILIFNIGLVALVGWGLLKFQDEWFLRLVLTTNLADIIGLVFLVVKFLFSNQQEIGQQITGNKE